MTCLQLLLSPVFIINFSLRRYRSTPKYPVPSAIGIVQTGSKFAREETDGPIPGGTTDPQASPDVWPGRQSRLSGRDLRCGVSRFDFYGRKSRIFQTPKTHKFSSTQVASELTSLKLKDGNHGFSNTQDFVFAAESPGCVSDRRGVVVAIRREGKQGQAGSRRHVAAPAPSPPGESAQKAPPRKAPPGDCSGRDVFTTEVAPSVADRHCSRGRRLRSSPCAPAAALPALHIHLISFQPFQFKQASPISAPRPHPHRLQVPPSACPSVRSSPALPPLFTLLPQSILLSLPPCLPPFVRPSVPSFGGWGGLSHSPQAGNRPLTRSPAAAAFREPTAAHGQGWQGLGRWPDPRPAPFDPGRNQRPAPRDPERPGPPGTARTFAKCPSRPEPGSGF